MKVIIEMKDSFTVQTLRDIIIGTMASKLPRDHTSQQVQDMIDFIDSFKITEVEK